MKNSTWIATIVKNDGSYYSYSYTNKKNALDEATELSLKGILVCVGQKEPRLKEYMEAPKFWENERKIIKKNNKYFLNGKEISYSDAKKKFLKLSWKTFEKYLNKGYY